MTSCPGGLGVWVRGPVGSTICPSRLIPVSECPRGGVVNYLSRLTRAPGARGSGVDHLSRLIWARVQGAEGSTSCPG